MRIDFKVEGLDQLRGQLAGFSDRRINAAIATGLTWTAQEGKAAANKALLHDIDRPTQYTQRALYMRPARADRLVAEVGFKDDLAGSGTPATRYLQPQADGGARNIKRFEKALQAKASMPVGWQAVPAAGARLDAYGNVSRGQIIQILSQVGTELTAGYSRSIVRPYDHGKGQQAKRRRALGRAGGQYVAITQQRGKLKPGIYLATGQDFGAKLGYGRTGKLVPVFIFVRATTYRRRFGFYDAVGEVVESRLTINVQRAIAESASRLAARGSGR